MKALFIDKYIVKTALKEILEFAKTQLINGKLRDIEDKVDELRITCPNDNHNGGLELSPDCHVSISKPDVPYGFFHCFACNEKGTFVRLIALTFSKSESWAKNWLITNFGELNDGAANLADDIRFKTTSISALLANSKPKKLDDDLNKYQSWSPYLAKRGLTRDLCARFNIKYDPENKQILFPCYSAHGQFITAPRRSILTKDFHLDPSIDKPLYCIDKIAENNIKSVLLVEGPIDCLTGWQYNIPTIATFGQPALSQIEQINKSGISVVYFMFDNDAAGRTFTAFVDNNLSKGIFREFVKIPLGKKDINELSAEEINKLIQENNLPQFNIFNANYHI